MALVGGSDSAGADQLQSLLGELRRSRMQNADRRADHRRDRDGSCDDCEQTLRKQILREQALPPCARGKRRAAGAHRNRRLHGPPGEEMAGHPRCGELRLLSKTCIVACIWAAILVAFFGGYRQLKAKPPPRGRNERKRMAPLRRIATALDLSENIAAQSAFLIPEIYRCEIASSRFLPDSVHLERQR